MAIVMLTRPSKHEPITVWPRERNLNTLTTSVKAKNVVSLRLVDLHSLGTRYSDSRIVGAHNLKPGTRPEKNLRIVFKHHRTNTVVTAFHDLDDCAVTSLLGEGSKIPPCIY